MNLQILHIDDFTSKSPCSVLLEIITCLMLVNCISNRLILDRFVVLAPID